MMDEGLDPNEIFVPPLYLLKYISEEGKKECKNQMALVKLKMSQNKTESHKPHQGMSEFKWGHKELIGMGRK